MSRRRAAEKRTILPDHKFKDLVIAIFMNRIMLDGKKSISEKIVYGAFEIISKKSEKDPLAFFHEALDNVKPNLEVKSRRVGGAKRNEKTMRERVAGEILDAHNNKGNAVKKREETHKMAEANRAFSHFRW